MPDNISFFVVVVVSLGLLTHCEKFPPLVVLFIILQSMKIILKSCPKGHKLL